MTLKANANDVITTKYNALKTSRSCNLENVVSKDEDLNKKLFVNSPSYYTENCKAKFDDILFDDLFHNSSLTYHSQIDDMRSIERTMLTHSSSPMKRIKKKSIKSHVENVLKSGFLSNEDSLLLQDTLELMKILSKIKSVQNQINIHRKTWEDEFGCKNEDVDKQIPELHFLNNRLELLGNQKNNYLTKTGLSYGRLYNRIVLNLKNAQKEAFKLYQDENNETRSQNKSVEQLISDIYNIQIVLDYLENNCGRKELPWRSSKGCPGRKKKMKKQLNCVTVVSDLQTIGEYEVMESVPQPLLIPVKRSILF